MSQPPTPYDRSYNFTDFQTTNPTTPLPGNKVDQELNNVRTSLNQAISRLGEVQRDDGKVRDSALNLDTIASAVSGQVSIAATQAVNAAGATQVGAVNSAGTTQIAAVNSAGASNLASLNAAINSTNATTAVNAATNASNSAAAALASKNAAAASAATAYTEMANASASAAAAEVSHVNALALAQDAANSAASASASASQAALSSAHASGYANDAEQSKLGALDAKAQAQAAAAQATNAVNNAGAIIIGDVQNLVDEAAASATASANSASSSNTYASQALTSKNAAAGSAGAAASSASSASSSATAAASSAAAAATFNPANFAPISHTHSIAQVTGLQSALDGKIAEAPTDGQQYARQSSGWSVVTPSSPSPADALDADHVNAVGNASFKAYGTVSPQGSFSYGDGTFSLSLPGAYEGNVQFISDTAFSITRVSVSTGDWQIRYPQSYLTGNPPASIADLVTFINGAGVGAVASYSGTGSSYNCDALDTTINTFSTTIGTTSLASGDKFLLANNNALLSALTDFARSNGAFEPGSGNAVALGYQNGVVTFFNLGGIYAPSANASFSGTLTSGGQFYSYNGMYVSGSNATYFSPNTVFQKYVSITNNTSDASLAIDATGTGSSLTVTNAGANPAVKITQTGTGNALVVEDAASPDSSPFIIDQYGNVLIGSTAQAYGYKVEVNGGIKALGTVDAQFLQLPGASSSGATLRLPQGSGPPTSPTSGDIWHLSNGLFIRVGATTQQVAFVNSPTFTGTPAAPTAVITDSSTTLATTALVKQGGRLLNVRYFTTAGSSTYTPTTGTQFVEVEVVGGGGGTNGVGTVNQTAYSGAGGAGAYASKKITSGFSGVTVTVGAAGAASGSALTGATNGGTSSFGALVSCTGGNAGGSTVSSGNSTGGSGGTATGGDLNVDGQAGLASFTGNSTGACGGSSAFGFGKGGCGGVTNATLYGSGQAGFGYGAGGGGGCRLTAGASGVAGTSGTQGIVIVREYC
jgi:hypothetical protein